MNSCKRFRGVGRVEAPCHPCSTWRESRLSFSMIPVSLWQAGWLAGDICLSVCCSCAYAWGGQQGPPPHMILALVYAGAPKPALCLCALVLWFCVLCICVLWCCGLCVPVPVWLCWSLVSLLHLCVHMGSVCPSLCWCCVLSFSQGRGGTPLQLHQ